ncbi:MAG: pyridoxamine 5'-phosphate oxidase family protein [Chloroflexi bacterium]|nr:pyridoxamine 5'-phosphate oxidase family protein [Chloroflexota bacterium]
MKRKSVVTDLKTLQALLQLFADLKFSWISSVRPDGRPHSVPICHVFDQGRVYMLTPPASIKVANIRSNPHVQVAGYLEDPEAGLICDGLAELAPERRQELSPLFEAKYGWNLVDEDIHTQVIIIVPTRLIAWGRYGEGHWGQEEIRAASKT